MPMVEGMLFPASYLRPEFSAAEEAAQEFAEWEAMVREERDVEFWAENAWLLELPEAHAI